jgi:general nucleoside transport system permease protein
VRARLGGLVFPLISLAVAFLVGGLVVIAAGSNPFTVYKSLWVGAGLDWPFQFIPGNPLGVNGQLAELNLVATIVQTTPLILTGLAVAFAFRAGLFNIGGQGQLTAGMLAAFLPALWIGGTLGWIAGAIAGALGGFVYGAIPGALKAFRGAHEVITTIMLNFIAIAFVGWLVGLGGPLQDKAGGQPYSETLPDDAFYPTVWGTLQAVHIGIFIALGAAAAYWAIVSRTTLGYEIRAVGFNAEAARYGGVSVRRSTVLAMGISGLFAGLAGAGEVLGVQHRIAEGDLTIVQWGFTGIAVALLGRNHAVGIVLAAFLFAALDSGARFLAGDFSAELARSLATIIQGMIILLVGGEQILRWLAARRLRAKPGETPSETPPGAVGPGVSPGGM